MRFQVTLDRDEDGVWVVECPAIPGCVSQGSSKQEALKNIEEAIALCLEVRAERGLPAFRSQTDRPSARGSESLRTAETSDAVRREV
jgi:predicted RNase H-like HicB family nuclease